MSKEKRLKPILRVFPGPHAVAQHWMLITWKFEEGSTFKQVEGENLKQSMRHVLRILAITELVSV